MAETIKVAVRAEKDTATITMEFKTDKLFHLFIRNIPYVYRHLPVFYTLIENKEIYMFIDEGDTDKISMVLDKLSEKCINDLKQSSN